MKKLICLIIGIIVLVSFIAEVQAQEKKQMWSDPVTVFRPLKKTEQRTVAENLNLTPDQKVEIRTLSQKSMTELKALADTYQQARQDLMTALEADNPNPDVVASGLKEVHKTHSALLEREVQYWNDLTSILNDEQATELWKLFADSRIKGVGKPTGAIIEPEEDM